MPTSLALFLLGGLSVAAADPATPAAGAGPVADPAAAPADVAAQMLEALAAQVAAREAGKLATEMELAALRQQLDDASLVVDPAAASARRREAMERLSRDGGDRALPFLHAAVRDPDPEIGADAVRAVGTMSTAAATSVARDMLQDEGLSPALRLAAVAALQAQASSAAGDALYAAAADTQLSGELRRAALASLEAGWPALLAERGRPSTGGSGWGAMVGTVGNGLAGGVILSSVGAWGQSSTATVIGAVGGGAIGAGTGLVYVLSEPVTLGQGMRYTSSVVWGLTGAQLVNQALLGPGYDPARTAAEEERRDNIAALSRTVLTAAGGVQGAMRMAHDPNANDVAESDLAGYLGAQVGAGAVDLALGNQGDCIYESRDSEEFFVEDCTGRVRWQRVRAGAALGGATGGLALAAWTREAWDPSRTDLAFASVVATELGVVGAALPRALDVRVDRGNFRTAFHAGGAIGLAAAHPMALEWQSPALGLWGGMLGNGLGAGVPLLAGATDDPQILWPLIGVGLAGTGAGLVLGPQAVVGSGDMAMMALGLGVGTLEGAAIGGVLEDAGIGWTGRQTAGLALTAGTASAAGLTLLSQRVEPQLANMVFLGSAAAWGSWYGFLTPMGLGLEGTTADALLTTTLVGDAFLLAGGILVAPNIVGLDPKDTTLAQLGGVTGATLGALGAAMATERRQTVALGAVIGSATGMLGGGLATALMADSGGARTAASFRHLGPLGGWDPPGRWSTQVAPAAMEDGSTGLSLGLRVDGL